MRALRLVFRHADSVLHFTSRMFILQKLSRLTMLFNMATIQIRFGGSLSVGVTSIPSGQHIVSITVTFPDCLIGI